MHPSMYSEQALPKPSLSALRSRLQDVADARRRMLFHLQNLQQRIDSPATTREEKLEMTNEVLESLDLEQRLEFDQAWVECEIGNLLFATWIACLDREVPLESSRFDYSKEKTESPPSGSFHVRSSVEDTAIARNSTFVSDKDNILKPAPLRVVNHEHHKARSMSILRDRTLSRPSSVLGQVSELQDNDPKGLAPEASRQETEPETKDFPLIQESRGSGTISSGISRTAWQQPKIVAAPEISRVNQRRIVETQSLAGNEQNIRRTMFKKWPSLVLRSRHGRGTN